MNAIDTAAAVTILAKLAANATEQASTYPRYSAPWLRHTIRAEAFNDSCLALDEARPVEGVTRCGCSSTYWDGAVCHSCGARFAPLADRTPERGGR